MVLNNNNFAQQWVEDHLDLLNWANQIGDKEWQLHIIDYLSKKEEHIAKDRNDSAHIDLCLRFDVVNNKLLELLTQMKEKSDTQEEDSTREMILKMELQRNELAKKMKDFCG